MKTIEYSRKLIDKHRGFRIAANKLNLRRVYALSLFLRSKSALHEIGWFKSSKSNSSIDHNGEPIPWLTYPVISFLADRVNKTMDIFEYGAGNSTLWWASRARSVKSCEHNDLWAAKIGKKLPGNAVIIPRKLGDDYINAILEKKDTFDIIVIDGRDRVACAKKAILRLKGNGVIVWDNTDRPYYNEGLDELTAGGFKVLDFIGMAPIDNAINKTSIFYRTNNCLDI